MIRLDSTNSDQTQTSVRVHQPSQLSRSLVITAVAALLIGRLFASYTPFWILGLASVIWIALKGNRTERYTLIMLFFLALLPGDQQMILGLRACVFLSMLMVFARYCQLNIYIHLLLQMAMMLATYDVGLQGLASFAFAPSVLLLIIAARHSQTGSTLARAFVGIYIFLSLAISSIGFGSRSALFVWLISMLRRHRYFLLLLSFIAIPTLSLFSEMPVVSKLTNSLSEITSPLEESGAINFRAIENLVFLDYISSATLPEFLFGSSKPIFLPGELVESLDDPIYIPHNQLMGLLFQFGLIGVVILGWYARSLFTYFRNHSDAVFFFLVLLPPFMMFKHGFLDSDFAMLLASLNWIRSQKGGIR
jgi:hypothetical protein